MAFYFSINFKGGILHIREWHSNRGVRVYFLVRLYLFVSGPTVLVYLSIFKANINSCYFWIYEQILNQN
ncbi:unnamed protein product [Meloidogyne enterolobii]|uniref:Uncharacterized protein n=1 Tax=Meloidogyne enterolobii TaxID=390850 RepID=A0ACB1ABB3_MELEN